jgi:ornithine cyclodeaminase/alanine dehydrogenase-like protein (mu-crystallin family)
MTALPYLDEETLARLVPWPDAVDCLESALLGGLRPEAALARTAHPLEHGQFLLMPAETPSAAGVKLSTVAPGNPERGLPRIQALFVLYDHQTLRPLALLDGTALTTLRTPAVSAVAVRHLARPDAGRVVLFGSGPQAWGHAHALAAVRPVRSLTVVARDPRRAALLTERLSGEGIAADTGSVAAVESADVVVCATTAREPLFDGHLLPEHACVVAVGSHEPDARELDETVFARAARVVVEAAEVALVEAGDVVAAVAADAVAAEALLGLADAVRLRPGPGISVFKSVGMGWEDLVVAEAAHRKWLADE